MVADNAFGYSNITLPLTLSPKVKYPDNPTTINKMEETIITTYTKLVKFFKDLSLASLMIENMF